MKCSLLKMEASILKQFLKKIMIILKFMLLSISDQNKSVITKTSKSKKKKKFSQKDLSS